ncbi:hypothetical protein IGI37_001183 [Enterococcus sp. AZ194]|uniref:phosphoglycerate dehydrogenase n=1 Tax=Enterococcus sp. AZ194 TaxID=2774629 RepID=UPI003F25377B
MSKKIIYSTRPFRSEFVSQIATIAPDLVWRTSIEESEILDIEIMLGWDKKLASTLLSSSTQLKWVQSISAGVDYLPLEQFSNRSILLSNASGLHSDSISQHVLGIILSDYRGIYSSILNQEKQQWKDDSLSFRSLEHTNMLIIGTGKIGQRLAELATPFGPTVIGINTSGHKVAHFNTTYPMSQLSDVLPTMDIVINILPLTMETTNLYNATFFSSMKPSASFINVGRGKSVVTKDIVYALTHKQFRFAALDVFEEEPLPQSSSLWSLENLLITPHLSGMTPNFQEKFMKIFLKNLKSYTEKQSLSVNSVDLAKGY